MTTNSYHETERIILINDADSPVSSIEPMYHAGDRKSGLYGPGLVGNVALNQILI
jgi:hypothetical protein